MFGYAACRSKSGQVTIDAKSAHALRALQGNAAAAAGSGLGRRQPGQGSRLRQLQLQLVEAVFARPKTPATSGSCATQKGQAHLRIKGNNGAAGEVAQTLYGLEGGKTYSASVWVELKGKRTASLTIRPVTRRRAPVRADGSPGLEDRARRQ